MRINHRHIAKWIRSAGPFVAALLVATSVVFVGFGGTARAQTVDSFQDASGATDTNDLWIEIVGGDSLSVDPGAVVTVVYRIASQSDTSANLTPHFDIPKGWNIVFGSQDIVLPAGESVTRFVTYKVPENALAGVYSPAFLVENEDQSRRASIHSKVNVHSLFNLSLDTGASPSFLAAGKSFDVPLTVANDGNAPMDVILSAEDRRYTSIELEKKRIRLEAGEHAEVAAHISTDADAERSQRIVIRIDARVAGQPDVKTFASVAFDIVPVFARMRPKAAKTPLSLSMETVGDEGGFSPQATIHASGKLLGGDVRVSAVMAESPRRRLYGQEPQISVQYAREQATVTVGDHSTYTSPMTLTGERGVGVAAQVQREKWRVKGSAQRSRAIVPVQERAAVSGTWIRNENSEMSANLLHRNEFFSGTLLTFRSLSKPFGPTSKLDVECGISNDRVLQDPSCMLQTVGSTRKVSYQLRAQRASVDFPGTIAGTRMMSAYTSFKMADSWRVEQMSTVMNRNVGSGAGRHNLYAKVGVNYSTRLAGGNLYATVHGIHSAARYSLLEGDTQRVQNTLRLSAGYQLRRKGLTTSFERGNATADEVAQASELTRVRLNGRYSVSSKLSLNATFEHSQGNLSSTAVDQKSRQLGLGAAVTVRKDVRASITAFHSVVESHFKQQYTSLRTGISKTFRSGKVLSLKAQFNHNSGRQTLRTADYHLSFTTPLSLPFMSRSGAGDLLNGRVVDVQTGSPVVGALLFLGNDLAITDEKGRFRFARPGQDIVFLRIDASSIGYDRTTVLPMPMEVTPEQFGLDELIIHVSKSGSISGTINVFRNGGAGKNLLGEQSAELENTGGLGGAVVQVENENIRRRIRTSDTGAFTFSQLPPGRYTVSVVRSNLDSDQQLESSSLEVLVELGGAVDLEFRVIPARKRIKMIKSTNLSLDIEDTSSPTNESSNNMPPGIEQDPTPDQMDGNEDGSSFPGKDSPEDRDADTTATSPAGLTNASDVGWFGRMKETARTDGSSKSSIRDASTPPFYLEQGTRPKGPNSPAYPLLFVLCILFLLVDADLLLRSIILGRRGNVLTMAESPWMTTARFTAVYAYLIITVTAFAGPLAGLSVSLALSGVSVAIETRTTYRAMLNVVLLQTVARRRSGDWIRLRNSAVQLLSVSLENTRVRHLNGLETTVPTHRLHVLSSLSPASGTYESVSITIDFSRMSDLRHVRGVLDEICSPLTPSSLSSCVHIAFEDVDASWTTARVDLVSEPDHQDLPIVSEMVEARLLETGIPLRKHTQVEKTAMHVFRGSPGPEGHSPAKRGSHLRLVKGPDQKAA